MEVLFLRIVMRIPYTARKTNTEILLEANKHTQRYYLKQTYIKILLEANKQTQRYYLKQHKQKHIIVDLRKRQAKFIAYILRKGKLEDIVTTRKISGKRDRG
jgi:hypothetical protein